jgi:aminomuconate-semialdehyde/2-hydroxymuconate-6-semialdehyde dehydrogenase
MITVKNSIGGKLQGSLSGLTLNNFAPASAEVYGEIPDSDKGDVQLAVDAAVQAFPHWSDKSISDRSRIMLKLADLIEENLNDFARAESLDTGKPITTAKTIDIPRAISNFRFFGSAIVNFGTEAHVDNEAINYTRRTPIGIVGCISPWNLPLYLFTWKIAPALAMGNCVIAKPSELTPVTAFMLSELANEAGFPPGTLNVLHGYGANVGQAIVDHPKVKAISFTGGTHTGRIIAEATARQFKKASLELGGKNPNIIFSDADLRDAVTTSVRSSFSNQGEICLCGSRILIQNDIFEEFKKHFLLQVDQLLIGDPSDEKTQFGALISEGHMKKVIAHIAQAKKEGGKVLCGGKILQIKGLSGWFVGPTVIEGLDSTCRLNQEEVFGPVVSLIPFEDEEEAIAIANGTKYGLSTSIWTSDLKRAHRVAHRMESGIVWINCWMLRDLRTPFGGVKQSGVGREGGNEALRFFSEPQNICIKS